MVKHGGVSSMTVKTGESSGSAYPAPKAIGVIIDALEDAGVEFFAENGCGPGVRLNTG